MGEEVIGHIPPEVHELARRLAKILEENLAAPTDKNTKEFNDLCDKIKALGFEVAVVAIKDEDGEVREFKLATYRLNGEMRLH